MNRRTFLKSGVVGGAALALGRWDVQAARAASTAAEGVEKTPWRLAECVQVSVVPEVATTLPPMGLVKLAGGGWGCHALEGQKGKAPFDIQIQGWLWTQAPELTGPWRRVSRIAFEDLNIQAPSYSSALRSTVQLRSGRILIPLQFNIGRKPDDIRKWDVCIIYSDDEGKTWRHTEPMRRQLNAASGVQPQSGTIQELADGSLLWGIGYYREDATIEKYLWGPISQAYVRSYDGGLTWRDFTSTAVSERTLFFRECALRVLANGEWLACLRVEDQGYNDGHHGPFAMPTCATIRSPDGKTWGEPRLCFNGVEAAMEVLPGGAVVVACRDQNYAALRISYDHGHTWGPYYDPFETPWKRRAKIVHGQWPPGGSPRIQALDDRTAVVAYETGIAPTGAVIDPPPPDSELQGWIAVRYLRR